MSRWLVSNVPAWLLLLGLIVVVVGTSMALQAFIRHRFPQLNGDAHNDATKFAFGVVGTLFAFFVGFVVSNMWSQINNADANARAEGSVGVQLARDLTVFDKADGDRIRQSLLDYGRAAEAEWPLAAEGLSYPAADDALARLYAAYEQVLPRTEVQKNRLAMSFTNLDKVSEARTERVLTARTGQGPPASLHYPMVATVGVLVAAQLFLILQLSHPYIGDIGTSAEPLREVVRVLTG